MSSVNKKNQKRGNKYLSQLRNISNETILIAALDHVKGEFICDSDLSLNISEYNNLENDDLDEQNFRARKCIYKFLKSLTTNVEKYDILESTIDESEFSSTFTTYLKEVSRAIMVNHGKKEPILIPKYDSSTWSVDIDLSSSYAMKLLDTSVMLSLNTKTTQNDTKQNCTRSILMTPEKFSELRYKVAEALKSLQDLKKRKMFATS